MEFDRYTIPLLIRGDHPPPLDERAEDALQDAHLAYLAKLHEDGHLPAAGPLLGPADRMLRGMNVFKVGPDRARELAEQDPAVRAGEFSIQIVPWMVPSGALRFSRTRFPHSTAEAEGD